MKQDFKIYYKNEELPLPCGESKGCFIFDDVPIITEMTTNDFLYYNRLMKVSNYSDEELLKFEKEMMDRKKEQEETKIDEDDDTIDFFANLK